MIWLGAGAYQTLKDDLIAAAIDLQDEFMRPGAGNIFRTEDQHQHNGRYSFFYTSDQRLNHLQEMLSAWLRNGRFDDSKVLVILDDVDGLGTSELSDLSNLISSDQVDVIYTTRDPMIADPSSHMQANNFEVAPLRPATADGLLQQIRKPTSPGISPRRHNSVDLPKEEIELTSKITGSLGHLPAAIINASHFLADNFGPAKAPPANTHALRAYLHRWESDDTRREILQYRRRTSRYPYTMWASYEISVRRLRRNTETGPKGLFHCSLSLLRLLCFMNVESFAQDQIEDLKTLLGNYVTSKSESSGIRTCLEVMSKDMIPIFRCITELAHVSLLSFSDGTDIMVINSLIKACALQCSRDSWNWQVDDVASSISTTEAAYLKEAADEISAHWAAASQRDVRRAPMAVSSSTH